MDSGYASAIDEYKEMTTQDQSEPIFEERRTVIGMGNHDSAYVNIPARDVNGIEVGDRVTVNIHDGFIVITNDE